MTTCKSQPFGTFDFVQKKRLSPSLLFFNMIAEIILEVLNTKEMQNYTVEKSILAVFEEIHVKVSFQQRKLLETK